MKKLRRKKSQSQERESVIKDQIADLEVDQSLGRRKTNTVQEVGKVPQDRVRKRRSNLINNFSIYEKILEQERNAAVAKGRDYAVRPTSYKSSLSQAVPTGNQKRRSKYL
jgi:hypothetical protein